MRDAVEVGPAGLRRHASRLDGIADALANAHQAGQAVRLGAGAYGQLCAFLPAVLDGLQQELIDGIATAQRSVRDTAGRVRTAAGRYDAADGRSATAFDRLGRPR
ncbi:MAG TPA: type VII secretion target [Jiangellales bacterium]|nr:type VII secretion target [Jiangellales bacterium]